MIIHLCMCQTKILSRSWMYSKNSHMARSRRVGGKKEENEGKGWGNRTGWWLRRGRGRGWLAASTFSRRGSAGVRTSARTIEMKWTGNINYTNTIVWYDLTNVSECAVVVRSSDGLRAASACQRATHYATGHFIWKLDCCSTQWPA